jgi:uncharacterized membrane protein
MDAQPSAPQGARAIGPPSGLIEYTHWIYALYALSVVGALATARAVALQFAFGLPSLVAIIMDYARRLEARGIWLETHFRWQIRTFWFALLWVVVTQIVTAPLVLVGVGFLPGLLGLGSVALWVIYRLVRGWLALREGRPMPLAMP